MVVRSGLAAGLAWWLAEVVIDEPSPVLASLTAVVVIQVSLQGSVKTALQRSLAVVLGVLLALAIGDALDLNALVVALLVAASLAVAELLLKLPRAAARQVPISVLVVLSAVSLSPESSGWHRAADTMVGAAVGVAVALAVPVSRLAEARRAIRQLADGLDSVLTAMATGVAEPWSTSQTEQWRREARTVRERLVPEATGAVGNGRDAIHWNVRDRRHVESLERFEAATPRLERAAIGVSVISRGLDDHAHLSDGPLPAMAGMGALLAALAGAVRALAANAVDGNGDERFAAALVDVHARRERCARAATRRARSAIDGDDAERDQLEGQWLNYAALLVQIDRIVVDLSAPLPS